MKKSPKSSGTSRQESQGSTRTSGERCQDSEMEECDSEVPSASNQHGDAAGQPTLDTGTMDANDDVGWIQALSRREKQRLNKEKKAELTVKESGKASLSSKPFSKPENEMQRLQRRRLPPLPRDDVKIVMKPRKGLSLKDYSTIEITKAIAEACD